MQLGVSTVELPFPKLSGPWLRILVAIAVISVGSGLLGWYIQLNPTDPIAQKFNIQAPNWADAWCVKHKCGDVLFRGLKSFQVAEVYDRLEQSEEDFPDNIYLEMARLSGLIVGFSTIIIFLRAFLGDSIVKLGINTKRRHIIIAGNSNFADRLGEALQDRAVHLCGIGDRAHMNGRTIRLPYATWRGHILDKAGVKHAEKLVVAPEEDAAAIDLALEAQELYPKLQTYVRLKNYGLAQRIQQLPGAERLRAFSDSGVAARDIARRHPPFLVAADSEHTRIHALLIGHTEWLEALMAEILASACTLTFGKPIFSFVCGAPDDFEEHLAQRYPELRKSADINFYAAGKLTHVPLSRTGLATIAAGHPITSAYIALDEQTEILAASLAFRDLASKDVTFTAPIFVRVRSPNGLKTQHPGSRLDPLSLVPFGSPEDITKALGLMAKPVDSAEKHFHEAYLLFAAPGGEANKPWEELKEEYRISNGRSVAHINAKLFEAGFNLRDWMHRKVDVWSTLPNLAQGQSLWHNPQELARLAELEHERWMVDRRLNGWRYGADRDNIRKLHPHLIPFSDLPEDVKRYDYALIEELAKRLGSAADGINRS